MLNDQDQPLHFLIADDHEIIRQGLIQRLRSINSMSKIDGVSSYEETMQKLSQKKYDLLVADLKMEHSNPITGISRILETYPDLKVLIMSMYPAEAFAIRLIKAGAKGYISKNAPFEDIIYAIREVLEGRKYVCTQLVSKLSSSISTTSNELLDKLTTREMEVMLLYINGYTSKDVGDELNIHSSTIGTYRHRIFQKLNVNNMVELTLFGIENDLIH